MSITQSFNTTTSMGRFTLNMLLSFAQFEREVTAERIRDKLAASKAKGMWMGVMPPLGFKADGRTLAIVEPQAALIREIYFRYLKLGNVRQLAEQFNREGTTVVPKRTAGQARPTAASRSPAANSMRSSRTRSTLATSRTRTRCVPATTRR